MKVRVHYELTTQWVAEVDYDELAEAWQSDAGEHTDDPREPLPSQERLRQIRGKGFGTVRIDQHADGNVDALLLDVGSEVDSNLAFITEIGMMRVETKTLLDISEIEVP